MLSFFKTKNKGLRIGLCLSKQSVSLVIIDRSDKKKLRIKNSFYCAFSSIEGEMDACIRQLSTFVEENSLKNVDCYGVLNKEDYQLLLVEPPDVPEVELLDAMKWKVRDLANVDIDKTIVEVFPQPEKKLLYTVVADKSMVVSLVNLVKNIGLSLVAIDIEELSYRNIFECLSDDENSIGTRGSAVISIEKNEGRLLIIKNGNIFLSRIFPINYGGGVFDAMPEDEVILELQRSLDYYERQMRQVAPAEIIFCGDVNEKNITQSMRESFQQKIRCTDINSMLDGHQLQMSASEALVVSGAAMRMESLS